MKNGGVTRRPPANRLEGALRGGELRRFPRIGNGNGNFSRPWKVSPSTFPSLGKVLAVFSKAWKFPTQLP
jgi:hypothetical protein